MKQLLRWQRTLILSMLYFTVLAPLFFVSNRLKIGIHIGRREFVEDLSTIQKYRTDVVTLKAIEQEWSEGLKEPNIVVYEDKNLASSVSDNSLERNSDSMKSGNIRDAANILDINSVSGTNHEREQDDQKIQTIAVPTNPHEKVLISLVIHGRLNCSNVEDGNIWFQNNGEEHWCRILLTVVSEHFDLCGPVPDLCDFMATGNVTLPSPPLFDGENYEFWAVKLRAYLMANDLWSTIQTGFVETPLSDDATVQQIKPNLPKVPGISNFPFERDLVNISASWSSVLHTWLLEMAIAALLSQYKIVGSFCSKLKSANNSLNQTAWFEAAAAATYSASAVDCAKTSCFFQLQEQSNQTTVLQTHDVQSQSQREMDVKVKQIRDHLIKAKAYLHFAPPGSNSNFVKELRVRLKELDRAVGEATKDSDLSRSALQKMRSMEVSLSKASHVFPDCSAMATKLRAMAYNSEEQVQAQRNQAAYLLQLAARTTPKGLHCLSMRLTAEYLGLQPEERQLSNQQKFYDPNFYHYAVFSDNVLACAVVVTSTISSAMDPQKIVVHVVTDALNYPALSMWFLLNPPGDATVQIQSIENFEGLLTKHDAMLKKHKSKDPRYTSALNHLRFYLPDVFPLLNKIVLFDHDVVVQRDLSGLWNINMKRKVNGAVKTCLESEDSFRRMDMLINFSDPLVAKRFDVKACTWAFGMNIFDLHEWRKHNLTAIYHRYLQLGYKRPLWKAGSLPLGWVTFYKQTIALDKRWHVLGLGYESGVRRGDIERAAVIHYDGVRKPWLDIGVKKYKSYWSKYVNYGHPYLQQCNIHD